MTGNILEEIEENIKDYEEQGIEQIPLSLVKYWISVLEKENEQLKAHNQYLIELLEHTGAIVEITKGDVE